MLLLLESDRIKLYSLVGMTGKPNLKRGEPMNTATTEPKSVKLKVAFATQPEFFCKPAEHRDSFVLVSELDTADYENADAFHAAIASKEAEARELCGQYVHCEYLNIVPTPQGDFFPTGGINWAERAWRFHEYLNGKPASGAWKHGDRINITNQAGLVLDLRIFGFDSDGDAILSWSCWWVAKPVGHLTLIQSADQAA